MNHHFIGGDPGMSCCPDTTRFHQADDLNGRRTQDFTELSVILVEHLLVYVQCQFRIPVVTQISS